MTVLGASHFGRKSNKLDKGKIISAAQLLFEMKASASEENVMWGQQGQKICDNKIKCLSLSAIIIGEEAFSKQLRMEKRGKKNTNKIYHKGATVKLLFRTLA